MTVYVVAQLKFTRRELYDRYQARFAEVFGRFDGRVLVADEHPRVLEGEWPRDKIVILEFPDAAAATAFHESPDYATIAVDSRAGAEAVVLMARGVR